jgi:hypothetical protein
MKKILSILLLIVGFSASGQSFFWSHNSEVSASVPTVTTTSITAITGIGATSGGNVTSDGGATVTARGIAWGQSTNPTTVGNTVASGSGTGSFSSTIIYASYYTLYYVRAYATNSAGTSYGNEVSFTTSADPNYVYTGASPLSQGPTSAYVFGVSTDGHGTISSRGFCWNTGGNPTLSDTVVTSGSGVGTFYATLTGLSPSTHYHYRAYVTIGGSTYYGADSNFMTTP